MIHRQVWYKIDKYASGADFTRFGVIEQGYVQISPA